MPVSRARTRGGPLHRRRATNRDSIAQRFGARVRFRDSAGQSWEREVDASSPLSAVGVPAQNALVATSMLGGLPNGSSIAGSPLKSRSRPRRCDQSRCPGMVNMLADNCHGQASTVPTSVRIWMRHKCVRFVVRFATSAVSIPFGWLTQLTAAPCAQITSDSGTRWSDTARLSGTRVRRRSS